MFKNPGKKVYGIAKVMFWMFSAVFVTLDIVAAVFMSVIIYSMTQLFNSVSNSLLNPSYSLFGFGSRSTNTAQIDSAPYIFLVWLFAVVFGVLIVMILYWCTLLIITYADTNIEVKNIREKMENQAMEYGSQSYDDFQNYQRNQANMQTAPAPTYREPEMVFYPVHNTQPAPTYQQTYQSAPDNTVSTGPSTNTDQQNVQQDVPQEEPQSLTKEDILNMYGSRGEIYK